jgi:beta-glucanase (GH16 family)
MKWIGKSLYVLIIREFTGQHNDEVNSNVFYKGIPEFSIHNVLLKVPGNGIGGSHIYTLDWKKDSLTWIIDGKPARTLFRENSTSPMVLFFYKLIL